MRLQPLAVARAVEVFGTLRLVLADAHGIHRHPSHLDRGFEHFAHHASDRRSLELDERAPVEGAREYRGVGKRFVHAFDHRGIELVAIETEQDQFGLGRSRLTQQVEPCAVAVINLGPEFPGDVDHLDVGVYQGHRNTLRDQHLADGLAETAITDDKSVGTVVLRSVTFSLDHRRLAEPARQHHQERCRRHRKGDDRAEQAGGRRIDEHRVLGLSEEHEPEFAPLAEQQAERERAAPGHPEDDADTKNDQRLGRDQRQCHADDEERLFGNDMEIEHHANREEEEAQQDRPERLDIGFQFVPVRTVGEHHARDERPERGRQAESLHDRGTGDDGEQSREHEHLALTHVADEPEQRAQEEAARENQSSDGKDRVECEQPARRSRRVGRIARHGGNDRDQRDDRQILEQQDREGPLTEWRAQSSRRLQHRKHLRRRRKGQRQAERERSRYRYTRSTPDHGTDGKTAQHDLEQAQTKDIAPHRPKPRGAEFETHEEQQQGDAEFRNPHLRFGTADKAQHLWTNQRTCNEIAQGRTEPEFAKQQDEDQREPEERCAFVEKRRGCVRFHQRAFSETWATASTNASNGKRIAAWRAG